MMNEDFSVMTPSEKDHEDDSSSTGCMNSGRGESNREDAEHDDVSVKAVRRPLDAKAGHSFGFVPHLRRRATKPLSNESTQDLVEEYLKTKKITLCPTQYADGAVKTSGDYEF